MARPTRIGGRIAVSYPVTFDDGTQKDVAPSEAVLLAALEFVEWYESEGQKRYQQRHQDALLGWIEAKALLRDYELFRHVARFLFQQGYNALPVPLKKHFEARVVAHDGGR